MKRIFAFIEDNPPVFIPVLLVLYMIGSALQIPLGIFHNDYQLCVHRAGAFWHVVGIIGLTGSIYFLDQFIQDKKSWVPKTASVSAIILFILFALTFSAFGGFDFSGFGLK